MFGKRCASQRAIFNYLHAGLSAGMSIDEVLERAEADHAPVNGSDEPHKASTPRLSNVRHGQRKSSRIRGLRRARRARRLALDGRETSRS
jgi:hypothetical protein